MVNAKELAAGLRDRIDAHFEWLLVRPNGRSFPLRKTEIEITSDAGKVLFGAFDDAGYGISRVQSLTFDEDELSLELTSRFGTAIETVRLVPRTPARELSRNVEIARLERANLIANALADTFTGLKIVRVALNAENGRLAQVIARQPSGKEFAVLTDVTAAMTHETIIASAILWLQKLRNRKKPINEIWIAAVRSQARNLQKLLALFNKNTAASFRLFQISNDSETPTLKELKPPPLASLWREKPRALVLPTSAEVSGTASAIIELSPSSIDSVFSRQGETLRFLGLPFARVRSVAGHEKAWFGIDGIRRPLHEKTWDDLVDLVGRLETYRNADPPNKRHEFYRGAPEAWLESILRRNIKQLDANLILSPLYNQFRTAADKIDLLAIRRDGRLVIIELKISPDRETVLQAADYWRKIELQRRRGELERVNAFGDMKILDKPALVYAVAPALSFHRDFGLFAKALRSEVEMLRFELREDWRSKIKILTRRDYSPSLTSL